MDREVLLFLGIVSTAVPTTSRFQCHDTVTATSGLLSKLEVVGVDPDSESELCRAMGKSQAVVCALGASESEPFNVKGPYEVSLNVPPVSDLFSLLLLQMLRLRWCG